jgi:hypothetical protein
LSAKYIFFLQTLIFKLLCLDLAFRCVTQTLISEMDEEPVEKKLKSNEQRSVYRNWAAHIIDYLYSNLTSFKRFESKPVVKIIFIYDRLHHR